MSIRMSGRERTLWNRQIGRDRALEIVTEEWRKRVAPLSPTKNPTAELLWELIQKIEADHKDERDEWRALQDKRFKAEERERKAKRAARGRRS